MTFDLGERSPRSKAQSEWADWNTSTASTPPLHTSHFVHVTDASQQRILFESPAPLHPLRQTAAWRRFDSKIRLQLRLRGDSQETACHHACQPRFRRTNGQA